MRNELSPILYLSEEDVKSVAASSGLTMKNFIEIIEEEFEAISAGDFQTFPHDKLVDMTPALRENTSRDNEYPPFDSCPRQLSAVSILGFRKNKEGPSRLFYPISFP